MKPYEETWKRSHLLVVVDEDDGYDLGPTCFGSGALPFVNHDADIARLTLAAQAPAMARLLLAVQWKGGDPAVGNECVSCFGDSTMGHQPNCALVTVLRAAGVIE